MDPQLVNEHVRPGVGGQSPRHIAVGPPQEQPALTGVAPQLPMGARPPSRRSRVQLVPFETVQTPTAEGTHRPALLKTKPGLHEHWPWTQVPASVDMLAEPLQV